MHLHNYYLLYSNNKNFYRTRSFTRITLLPCTFIASRLLLLVRSIELFGNMHAHSKIVKYMLPVMARSRGTGAVWPRADLMSWQAH